MLQTQGEQLRSRWQNTRLLVQVTAIPTGSNGIARDLGRIEPLFNGCKVQQELHYDQRCTETFCHHSGALQIREPESGFGAAAV